MDQFRPVLTSTSVSFGIIETFLADLEVGLIICTVRKYPFSVKSRVSFPYLMMPL